ncbi:MAG TPA: hypothetical protein VK644_14465 [Chitinophagaceae bacterium]|nr:hypothetical protein [Chitinophagaceae bacterium]
MKFLPLVALLLAAQVVRAQLPGRLPLSKQLKEWRSPQLSLGTSVLEHLRNPGWKPVDGESASFRIITRSFTSGTTITILTGDFMPCLIPSMQLFNMPNVGKDIKLPAEAGVIPNPIR